MENHLSIFNFKKKLIFKIFTFLIAFFILDQILGIFLRASTDHVSKYWSRRHLKIHHVLNEKYDYLIFGSSKSMYSINPKSLNSDWGLSGFNASIEASDIHFYIDVLEMLIKKKNIPKTIIFNIFALSIEKSIINDSNVFNILGPQEPGSNLYKKIFPFESRFRFINSLRFHKTLPDILNGFRKNKAYNKLGFRPRDGHICKDNKICKTNKEYEESSWKELRGELSYSFDLLERFISLAEKNGINVIFIASPIYNPTTLQLRKEFYYWGLIKNYLSSKNKIFLDYRKDVEFFRRPEFFSDLIHLNVKGSKKFTKVLSSDLGKYLRRD